MNWKPEQEDVPDFTLESLRRLVEIRIDTLKSMEVSGDHILNPALGRADVRMELKDAAVLIPIVDRDGQASVMLTRRTENLPNHAGQVAFPGGKVEASDVNETATAIRESEEEIGLNKKFVTPLATLPPYLAYSGFRIFPVLAVVGAGFNLTINRGEVEAVFEVPLQFLMTTANHERRSRQVDGVERHYYVIPYREHYIWGVTAGIIRSVYERIFAKC